MLQKLVNQVDTDGDGTIDFQEFISLMQRARQSLVREPEKWEGHLRACVLARQYRRTTLLWSERQYHPVTTCHRELAVYSPKIQTCCFVSSCAFQVIPPSITVGEVCKTLIMFQQNSVRGKAGMRSHTQSKEMLEAIQRYSVIERCGFHRPPACMLMFTI